MDNPQDIYGLHVFSLSFNPDGQRLASGHREGAVILWDLQSCQSLLNFEGHKEALLRVWHSARTDPLWLQEAGAEP